MLTFAKQPNITFSSTMKNSEFHRQVHFVHKWVGLLIGIFLFISCFTGAMILIGKLSGSHAEFFGTMKSFHRSLFLGSSGRFIVGSATLLLIIEVVTGYWLWYDVAMTLIYSARRRGAGALYGLRQSLSWAKPNPRYGLHVGPGIWVGIPLLLMAFTGLTWSFQWWNDFIYYIFDPTGEVSTFHTIHSLHVGSFAGTASRILWLAVAIIGASLPISGLLIFLHRPPKKKQN